MLNDPKISVNSQPYRDAVVEAAFKVLANNGVLMEGGTYRYLPSERGRFFLGALGVTEYGRVLLYTHDSISNFAMLKYRITAIGGTRPDAKNHLLEKNNFEMCVVDDLSSDQTGGPWLKASISTAEIIETYDNVYLTPRLKADFPIRILDIVNELNKPGMILSK